MRVNSEVEFLSISALHEFVTESRLEAERQNSYLEFELRDEPTPHFCKWCGLNVHALGACPYGN